MTQLSRELSNKIANMSFVCALMVVFIHLHFGENPTPSMRIVERVIDGGFCRMAVPFFFVVSGYFLGRHCAEEGWWKEAVVKRIRSILVPFVLWALLSQLVAMPLAFCANKIAGRALFANIPLFSSRIVEVFGLDFFHYPTLVPLWYLRSLFIFVVLSFALWPMLKKAWFVVIPALYFIPRFGSDMAFFSLGLSLGGGVIKVMCNRYLAIVAAAVGVALIACGNVCPKIYVPCVLFATWFSMPRVKALPTWLSGVSFAIYLMHPIVYNYYETATRNLHLHNWWTIGFAYVLAVVLPVIAANLMRVRCPKVYEVLMGGRS